MSHFRLVALLSVLGAPGCYSDAPTQSTLPEPSYFTGGYAGPSGGPPGGAMDPSSAYAPPDNTQPTSDPAYQAPAAGDADDDDDDAAPPTAPTAPSTSDDAALADPPAEASPDGWQGPAPAPGPVPMAAAPTLDDGAPSDQDVTEAAPAPQPADPMAGVTDPEIDATLQGYGQWVETDDYGPVWRPDATVVGVDFTPYESGGSWAYTDAGWAFACDYSWGWLPFHYGRWAWFHDYWGWVPGHRWAPAWVEWRHGGGVVGWRPMAPRIRDHRRGYPDPRDHHFGGGSLIRDHRHAETHDAHWRFATTTDFGRPHIRSHLYNNPAEGLRVTSRVAAPPLRARTTVRAGDLMRNRFAGGRWTQPGPGRSVGPQQVRDHRAVDPRGYPAAPGSGGGERYRPYDRTRSYPPMPSGNTSGPMVRDHRAVDPRGVQPAPGVRGPGYQPYDRSRGYPPAQPGRPPVRTQPYNPQVQPYPPARPYQPPARTYQPPARTYQPPARTYQPPARTYQPPARTYQPPPRAYAPPARTYNPPAPSAAPSRSWTPPSRAAAPSSSASSGSRSSSSNSSSSSSSHGGGGRHR